MPTRLTGAVIAALCLLPIAAFVYGPFLSLTFWGVGFGPRWPRTSGK